LSAHRCAKWAWQLGKKITQIVKEIGPEVKTPHKFQSIGIKQSVTQNTPIHKKNLEID
jgi:hypothetical protein